MDALSDVLRAVRLTGAVFFDVHASEPWVAETPQGESIVGAIFPGADHLIPYHVITGGACFGGLIGQPAIHLSAGDVIVFPHGDAHAMSSAPGMRDAPDPWKFRRPGDGQLPFSISMGEATPSRRTWCAAFWRAMRGRSTRCCRRCRRSSRSAIAQGGAIAAFVQFALAESKAPRLGGESVLGRLSELMFVDVVRRYLESLPADRTDWLAALREPFVGRALTALHRSPARDWTLESLAREVGLSRSALAERFTRLCRAAADAVPDELADAACREPPAERHGQRRRGGRARRLRVRGGVQPGVQEGGGHAAEPLAEAPQRQRGAPGVVVPTRSSA